MRLLEDSAKLGAVVANPEGHLGTLRVKRTISVPFAATVAALPVGGGSLLVADNASGALAIVRGSGSLPRVLSLHALNYPIASRRYESMVYVSDNTGVHVFDQTFRERGTIQSGFGVYDFDVLDRHRLVISANRRGVTTGPVLLELDEKGVVVRRLGRMNLGPFGLYGRAKVAVCDDSALAAMAYEPELWFFSLDGTFARKVDPHLPGEPALAARGGRPDF